MEVSSQYRAGKLKLDDDVLSRHSHEVTKDAVSRKKQERIDKFLTLHLENPRNHKVVILSHIL